MIWSPLVLVLLSGCHKEMGDQPKYETFERNDFFADGRSARLPPEGTVEFGSPESVSGFPATLDMAYVERGRERFEIFCSVCHGRTGDGDGMVVSRGYPRPLSYHDPRLQQVPPSYFVEVIRRGMGIMPSYAAKIPDRDQWAIAAYVRALQLSRSFPEKDLSAEDRSHLQQSEEGP